MASANWLINRTNTLSSTHWNYRISRSRPLVDTLSAAIVRVDWSVKPTESVCHCVCVLVCVLVCRLNRRFIALSPSQDLRVDDEVGAFPLFVRPQFGRGGGIFFPLHRVRRSSCAAARGTPGGRPINAASLFMRPFVRYRLNVSVMCKCAEFNDLALISFEINFKLAVLN